MKLVILGASGRTGREVVKQALARGHGVTAVVRNPASLAEQANLKIVKADVTDASELTKVFLGQDAVISTLGTNNAGLRLIERSTEAIIRAMQATAVKRIVIESAFGASDTIRTIGFARFLNTVFLKKMLADKVQGENKLRASELQWTIVYPTILTNKPLTQHYQIVADGEKVSGHSKIARADVAYCMLELLEKNSHRNASVVITG